MRKRGVLFKDKETKNSVFISILSTTDDTIIDEVNMVSMDPVRHQEYSGISLCHSNALEPFTSNQYV